ncbi:MAG: helix-turn-helix domain-containing protein [Candidatus Levybacteria bacterium]|nr:helix-turn-helix domain-containing protein [Candidatus Levybacteria bacterium]
MIRIGQKLHEERARRGLSLDDVAKATRIKPSFLSAIERGEYHKLPSSAYAQGFVQNYAAFLGFPKRETLALFRREFAGEKDIRVLPEGFTETGSYPFRSIRTHQTFLLILGSILILAGYVLFQYRFILLNPPLSVSSPKGGEIAFAKEITVVGKTDPNATVYVNNDAVVVSRNGEFMKKITAFTGKTVIVVKAKNRLGRETTIERMIEVK